MTFYWNSIDLLAYSVGRQYARNPETGLTRVISVIRLGTLTLPTIRASKMPIHVVQTAQRRPKDGVILQHARKRYAFLLCLSALELI
ncbi:hypothetical protein SeMB42_g00316 [Synchytrium endobioticum]|uniref:Uncharacterized protein n=1 Tax=Synchytrium endobioticum TaxID=286115 RepID=A0A507DSZ5_9FUNG|nr:hypothetical protein SeMB42_g00316 [Synchytrium endobioticum]